MGAAKRSQRTADRLSELEERLSAEDRYLDLALQFRRKKTGEILLTVGGQWDLLTETFTTSEPKTCRVIYVKESQVAIVRKFAQWLARFIAGERRERLLLTGGKRRGGKSYVCVACIVAIAIAVPDALCWMVSPTLGKRDELERYFKEIVPVEWRSAPHGGYRGMPEYRFTLPTWSTVQSLTGADSDALKRGEATAILYNEPQDCGVDVATYGLPALIDEGGLGLFAGNPARKRKGEWFNALRQAILEDTRAVPLGAFFDVPAELNDAIDQAARSDIGDLLRILDPRAAAADDEGLWLPVNDRAYSHFDAKLNLKQQPDVRDITGELTKKKAGRAFPNWGGADFQGNPYNAGVILKAFGDPKRPTYCAVGEVLRQGFEDEFLDEVWTAGKWEPETLMWIGDASGTWQDSKHTRGRVSFDIFKARRWRIEPPQVKQSDRGNHPRNPDVEDRVNLVNKLLAQGRLIIDPALCPRLAEALRECELGKDGKPRGKHAHITDALGYALWWMEPTPKPVPGRPTSDGIFIANVRPTGPRTL